jgi:hypothetical protein
VDSSIPKLLRTCNHFSASGRLLRGDRLICVRLRYYQLMETHYLDHFSTWPRSTATEWLAIASRAVFSTGDWTDCCKGGCQFKSGTGRQCVQSGPKWVRTGFSTVEYGFLDSGSLSVRAMASHASECPVIARESAC